MGVKMRIVVTPMCQEILEMAGATDFLVNKFPDREDADLAVVLSETETKMDSVKIKLNTFSQIEESVIILYKILNNLDDSPENYSMDNRDMERLKKDISVKINSKWLHSEEKMRLKKINRKIKVRVYSNFLKDIIEDMGYHIIGPHSEREPDYVVYPDYMEVDIQGELGDYNAIKIPSHGDVPLNPVERAHLRYNLLEREICTKP